MILPWSMLSDGLSSLHESMTRCSKMQPCTWMTMMMAMMMMTMMMMRMMMMTMMMMMMTMIMMRMRMKAKPLWNS